MIINNWRNGFGNDGHTDILVHSNDIIGGGNTFVDSSPNDRIMSTKINGSDTNTQHSTTHHNLGLSSIKFTHPTDACSGSTLWSDDGRNIGVQDYCFDAWIYVEIDAIMPFSDYFYMGYFDADEVNLLNNAIYLRIDTSLQGADYIFSDNGSVYNIYHSDTAYITDRWNHFALTRKGNWFYFYMNGVLTGSNNYGSIKNFTYVSRPMHVLYYNCGDCSVPRKFYVEEWRQSIGTYRWDRNFIPPNRFF